MGQCGPCDRTGPLKFWGPQIPAQACTLSVSQRNFPDHNFPDGPTAAHLKVQFWNDKQSSRITSLTRAVGFAIGLLWKPNKKMNRSSPRLPERSPWKPNKKMTGKNIQMPSANSRSPCVPACSLTGCSIWWIDRRQETVPIWFCQRRFSLFLLNSKSIYHVRQARFDPIIYFL
jgi:hypothetical protein